MSITRLGARSIVPALALLAGGCLEITKNVTEGPGPVPFPRLVSVKLEYRQHNECFNVVAPERCAGHVVFFASWMRPGGEVVLSQTPGTFIWTGTVTNVPVNFPPRDQPHLVRVFDPHLIETDTGGVTALRLFVGGQIITFFNEPGTANENGVIYIDDNGVGRNPF